MEARETCNLLPGSKGAGPAVACSELLTEHCLWCLIESAQQPVSTESHYPHLTERETEVQRGCAFPMPVSDISGFEGKAPDSCVS